MNNQPASIQISLGALYFITFFLIVSSQTSLMPLNNLKQLQTVFSIARDRGTGRICYDTTSPELFDDFLVYSSIVSVLMFALPFMVVMVCYGLMVRKLLEPGWGSEGRTERLGQTSRYKQKSVKMIIIVLAAFMLCFLPFHLTRSLYYSFRYLRQVDPTQVRTNIVSIITNLYKYDYFKSSAYLISYAFNRSAVVCWRPPVWPTRWHDLWQAPTAVWTPSFTSWLGRTPAAISPKRVNWAHRNQHVWRKAWQHNSDPEPETICVKIKPLRGQMKDLLTVSSCGRDVSSQLQEDTF